MFRISFLLLTLFLNSSIKCQSKAIFISFEKQLSELKYDSTVVGLITIMGKDTSQRILKRQDSVIFDFAKCASYKINLNILNVSITIDSIKSDIDAISVYLVPNTLRYGEYCILRDGSFSLASYSSDCFRTPSCRHIVIARTAQGNAEVNEMNAQGLRGRGSRADKTRYFINGKEVTEEEMVEYER